MRGGLTLGIALFVAASASSLPKPVASTGLSAVWANDGGDKVARYELRATQPGGKSVANGVMKDDTVTLFGARNEVVSFALVLESADGAKDVSVRLASLTGPGGGELTSGAPGRQRKQLFDWTDRQIELFVVRYLQVRGLSRLTWDEYDERHIPQRFRRPHDERGISKGTWEERPDADAFYPEIAVPHEANPRFLVPARTNQTVWADIYIPKTAAPGQYDGTIEVLEGGKVTWRVPVMLDVRRFALPDMPSARTMLYLGYADINNRYLGTRYPDAGPKGDRAHEIIDRHFLLAHRHKIALIDSNHGPEPWKEDAPRPQWIPRLNGQLFTRARGYDGPGVGVGNGVFSIGTYNSWSWKDGTEADMHQHLDRWAQWFRRNSPRTEAFLYLLDESTDYEKVEKWARWMRSNRGPGRDIPGLATASWPKSVKFMPSLDIPCATIKVGARKSWAAARQRIIDAPRKKLWIYNGARPASGSLALEDDGVALRTWGWIQFKFDIERWFVWESTYYNNYQGGQGETNVFARAQTFGGRNDTRDKALGETGWNYTNGDGVLFYPGIDMKFPDVSLGIPGPVASLRLKHWRRGIQDHDYLVLAKARNPRAVAKLVEELVSNTLYEPGIDNPVDPTYKHTDIGWPTDPDTWETARRKLADIIEGPRR